jgi:chemotaxis protein MotB
MTRKNRFRWALWILAFMPFLAGCNSSAYQRAIDARDADLQRSLRDQNRLREQLAGKDAHIDRLQAQLTDKELQLQARPAPASAPQLTGFENLGVPIGVNADGYLVITLPSAISFGSGKAELTEEGMTTLERIAKQLMREYPGAEFHIEGHTDNDPIRKSSFASNRELSIARAMEVLAYLVSEDCKIPDKDCVLVGRGQYDPITSNDSNENKARNRRVEIVVHPPN